MYVEKFCKNEMKIAVKISSSKVRYALLVAEHFHMTIETLKMNSFSKEDEAAAELKFFIPVSMRSFALTFFFTQYTLTVLKSI